MIKPGNMMADEWLYLSTPVTAITTATQTILSRGLNDGEIVVDSIVASEWAGATPTLSVRIVPYGGTAGTGNTIWEAVAMTAKQQLVLPVNGREHGFISLNPGDSIQMLASANNNVNAIINYRKRR